MFDPGHAEELEAGARAYLAGRRHSLAVTQWRAAVPDRFRDAQASSPEVLRLVDHVSAGRRGGGLLALGPYGRGKTHDAYAALNAIVESGCVHPSRILHGTEAELLSSVANAPFADRERLRSRLLSRRWRIVFVDDIGLADYARVDVQHSLWKELLDHVWKHKLTFLATSNFDVQGTRVRPGTRQNETYRPLEEWLGGPTYSRLRAVVGDGSYRKSDEPDYRQLFADHD